MLAVSSDKDDLIRAQNELIGVLFEIIKRLQANNALDEEYFQLMASEKTDIIQKRLDEILSQRTDNSKTVAKLLEKLDV
jgi:hypothetical protein